LGRSRCPLTRRLIVRVSSTAIEAQKEGKVMTLRQLMGCSAAAAVGAGAMLASIATAEATMLPATNYATSYVQHVDCAVGAHVGPLGGCILGTDNPNPPVIVEHRSADVPAAPDQDGCASKSVTRTDGMGNSETKTKTNC
jgi:homoserine kinase